MVTEKQPPLSEKVKIPFNVRFLVSLQVIFKLIIGDLPSSTEAAKKRQRLLDYRAAEILVKDNLDASHTPAEKLQKLYEAIAIIDGWEYPYALVFPFTKLLEVIEENGNVRPHGLSSSQIEKLIENVKHLNRTHRAGMLQDIQYHLRQMSKYYEITVVPKPLEKHVPMVK